MDAVEIAMDIETEFGIDLKDDDLVEVRTVDDYCKITESTIAATGTVITELVRADIHVRVRKIVGELLGIDPTAIKGSDRIVEDLGAT